MCDGRAEWETEGRGGAAKQVEEKETGVALTFMTGGIKTWRLGLVPKHRRGCRRLPCGPLMQAGERAVERLADVGQWAMGSWRQVGAGDADGRDRASLPEALQCGPHGQQGC